MNYVSYIHDTCSYDVHSLIGIALMNTCHDPASYLPRLILLRVDVYKCIKQIFGKRASNSSGL